MKKHTKKRAEHNRSALFASSTLLNAYKQTPFVFIFDYATTFSCCTRYTPGDKASKQFHPRCKHLQK